MSRYARLRPSFLLSFGSFRHSITTSTLRNSRSVRKNLSTTRFMSFIPYIILAFELVINFRELISKSISNLVRNGGR